jgi:hypothetical protein
MPQRDRSRNPCFASAAKAGGRDENNWSSGFKPSELIGLDSGFTRPVPRQFVLL